MTVGWSAPEMMASESDVDGGKNRTQNAPSSIQVINDECVTGARPIGVRSLCALRMRSSKRSNHSASSLFQHFQNNYFPFFLVTGSVLFLFVPFRSVGFGI